MAGFVLANGSMSTHTNSEGEIRRKIIENDLVDCMIAMPGQLFFTTPISVCIWVLSKKKKRPNETLFIDARLIGQIGEATKNRFLSDKEISKLAKTYHNWQNRNDYSDTLGFCASATTEEIKKLGYILTPGRYVGSKKIESDDVNFEEKMSLLCSELNELRIKSYELDDKVASSLRTLGFEL